MSLLEVRGLDAGYGDLQILTDVDLDVDDEEYVTIVGPNGAGKSTVMKSVFGLTTHMGGTVTFDGEDISGTNPEEIIHKGLGYVPQNENIFAELDVEENLEMGRTSSTRSRRRSSERCTTGSRSSRSGNTSRRAR